MPIGGGFSGGNGCGDSRGSCPHPKEPVAVQGYCLNDEPVMVVVSADCCEKVTALGYVTVKDGRWHPGKLPEGIVQCKQEIKLDNVEVKIDNAAIAKAITDAFKDVTVKVDNSDIIKALRDLKVNVTVDQSAVIRKLDELIGKIGNQKVEIDTKALIDALKELRVKLDPIELRKALEDLKVKIDASDIAAEIKKALADLKVTVDNKDILAKLDDLIKKIGDQKVEIDVEALRKALEGIKVQIGTRAIIDKLAKIQAAIENLKVNVEVDNSDVIAALKDLKVRIDPTENTVKLDKATLDALCKCLEGVGIEIDAEKIAAAIRDALKDVTVKIDPTDPIKVEFDPEALKAAFEDVVVKLDPNARVKIDDTDPIKVTIDGKEITVKLDPDQKVQIEGGPITVEGIEDIKAALEDLNVTIDAEALEAAFKAALADATIKVAGPVEVTGEVTAKLDPETTVKLDPNAEVKVTGGPIEVTGIEDIVAKLEDLNVTIDPAKLKEALADITVKVEGGPIEVDGEKLKAALENLAVTFDPEALKAAFEDVTVKLDPDAKIKIEGGNTDPVKVEIEGLESGIELDPGIRCQTLVMHDGSCTEFLRTICRDKDGEIAQQLDTALDGSTEYTPKARGGETGDDKTACVFAGPVPPDCCPDCDESESGESWGEFDDGYGVDCEPLVLCDDNGEFVRTVCYDEATGNTLSRVDTTLDGKPYTPSGKVKSCGGGKVSIEGDGLTVKIDAEQMKALTECCPTTTTLTLCDDNGPFFRHVTRASDGKITTADTDLTGGAYTVAGEVKVCNSGGGGECKEETSSQVLCDTLTDGTVVRFKRTTTTQCPVGTPPIVKDTTEDGSAEYKTQGKVGPCDDDDDTVTKVETCTFTRPATWVPIDITTLPETKDTPHNGTVTLPRMGKVGYTVQGGKLEVSDDGIAGYLFSAINSKYPKSPQKWTFTEPVKVRVGINNLQSLTAIGLPLGTQEAVKFPPVFVPEKDGIDGEHSWHPDTNTLWAKQGILDLRASAKYISKLKTPIRVTGFDLTDATDRGILGTFGLTQFTQVGTASVEIEDPETRIEVTRTTVSKKSTGEVISVTVTDQDGKTIDVEKGELDCTADRPKPCPKEDWFSCEAKRPNGLWVIYSKRTVTPCEGEPYDVITLNGKPYTVADDATVVCKPVNNGEEARKKEDEGCEGGNRVQHTECDFTLPDRWVPVDLTVLPETKDTPHAGTFEDHAGTGFTVKGGRQASTAGGATDSARGYAFSALNDADPGPDQTWTFTRPVRVRVGVNNIDCFQRNRTFPLPPTWDPEGIKFPGGFKKDSLNDAHGWDEAAQTVKSKCPSYDLNVTSALESTFTSTGEIEKLTLTDISDPLIGSDSAKSGVAVSRMEVLDPARTIRVMREVTTECGTGKIISDKLFNKETGEELTHDSGELGECQQWTPGPVVLCPRDEYWSCTDDGDEWTTTYTRHRHTPCEGPVTDVRTFEGDPFDPTKPIDEQVCKKTTTKKEAEELEKRVKKDDCPEREVVSDCVEVTVMDGTEGLLDVKKWGKSYRLSRPHDDTWAGIGYRVQGMEYDDRYWNAVLDVVQVADPTQSGGSNETGARGWMDWEKPVVVQSYDFGGLLIKSGLGDSYSFPEGHRPDMTAEELAADHYTWDPATRTLTALPVPGKKDSDHGFYRHRTIPFVTDGTPVTHVEWTRIRAKDNGAYFRNLRMFVAGESNKVVKRETVDCHDKVIKTVYEMPEGTPYPDIDVSKVKDCVERKEEDKVEQLCDHFREDGEWKSVEFTRTTKANGDITDTLQDGSEYEVQGDEGECGRPFPDCPTIEKIPACDFFEGVDKIDVGLTTNWTPGPDDTFTQTVQVRSPGRGAFFFKSQEGFRVTISAGGKDIAQMERPVTQPDKAYQFMLTYKLPEGATEITITIKSLTKVITETGAGTFVPDRIEHAHGAKTEVRLLRETDCDDNVRDIGFELPDGTPYTMKGKQGDCAQEVDIPECPSFRERTCTETVNGEKVKFTHWILTDCDGNDVERFERDGIAYEPKTEKGTWECTEENDCVNGQRTSMSECDFFVKEKVDHVIDLSKLAASPVGQPVTGTLPDGTTWTIEGGKWVDSPAPGYAFSRHNPEFFGADLKITFSKPVTARVGINNLNVVSSEGVTAEIFGDERVLIPTVLDAAIQAPGAIAEGHTMGFDDHVLSLVEAFDRQDGSEAWESTFGTKVPVTELVFSDRTELTAAVADATGATFVALSRLEVEGSTEVEKKIRVQRFQTTDCETGLPIGDPLIISLEDGSLYGKDDGRMGECGPKD